MTQQVIDNDEEIRTVLGLLPDNKAFVAELTEAKRSLFYLWWQCLSESEDYARALKGKLGDPWAAMAQDFGELRGNFYLWWLMQGRYLFAEKVYHAPIDDISGYSRNTSDQLTVWNDRARPNLYLRIPLTLDRKAILSQIEEKLDFQLAKRQAEIQAAKHPKRDFYPDQRIRRDTIETLLKVWRATKEAEGWYEIGERLKLRPEFTVQPDDDADTIKHKRRMMTLTVQRYHKMAATMIGYAARGDFPRVK